LSFTQKQIEVTIQLVANPVTNQPVTFDGNSNTTTLSGSRTSVRINNSGMPNGGIAEVSVYGLTLALMNQLSTLGMVFNIVPKNKITITAGDAVTGLATVFTGVIVHAYGDFNKMPDVPFVIIANSGIADSVAPAVASSFTGPTDVATIMAGFARQMNLGFENNGVNVKLSNPYFPGNIQQQADACARAAGIKWDRVIGPGGPVLAIWPRGGNRNTPTIPIISPSPGTMIGYPSYTQQGIKIDNLFDPNISRGQLVQVQGSQLTKANGMWAIYKLDHALDSQVPRGHWMSSLYCYNPKYPQPIPPQA
jgi:hypothetical protein